MQKVKHVVPLTIKSQVRKAIEKKKKLLKKAIEDLIVFDKESSSEKKHDYSWIVELDIKY